MGYLSKAMTIAQLRSPNSDDGTMAHILWKTSEILDQDPYSAYRKEADQSRIRAEVARQELTRNGEGTGIAFAIEEDGNVESADVEDSYDFLVPFLYR